MANVLGLKFMKGFVWPGFGKYRLDYVHNPIGIIGLFLLVRFFGLSASYTQLNKRLEQEKHSTYCTDFYKYIFCNKSFCCKTPYQQSPGAGIWFKCGKDWGFCNFILDIVFN